MTSSLSKLFLFCLCLNSFAMSSIYGKDGQAPKNARKDSTELSDYDRRVLENGEISGLRRATGSVLAAIPGFGIGHAVQGRYRYKGMIFTLTELGCVGIMLGPTGEGGFALGFLPFLGFKIWEFVDAIVGSGRDNIRYHQLQSTSSESDDSHLKILPVPLVRNHDSGHRATHLGLALTWDISW